ncbi:unnamed protein product [Phaedon cochleariae]|uniref:Uncharacterized protein n=1 Tax=Phaedon cochleariae TaxID=80249 RepID=A0A9N9SAD4_PHACE|nr:unnamed protein product [Phaedon cochleariae]
MGSSSDEKGLVSRNERSAQCLVDNVTISERDNEQSAQLLEDITMISGNQDRAIIEEPHHSNSFSSKHSNSSSSSSSASESDTSSSSEDCEDLINDKLYTPESDDSEEDSGKENNGVNQKDNDTLHLDTTNKPSTPNQDIPILTSPADKGVKHSSRSLADIHRDYVSKCREKNEPYGSYAIFQRVFTNEFNISFFVPKKDLCETCVAYENATNEEKQHLKDKYDLHLTEKKLSREEKKLDKENIKSNGIVAVYDLQAVMPIPKGDVSVFFCKSKLNVLNFTIYDLQTNNCECYVWDESNGHRGVNELGSCVQKYLQKKATITDCEVIFYSDNCLGQQKNKFIIHKFLIKGHTQNEGDSAHSLIERQVKRQLRGGPMYTPDAFIAAIRTAKKKGTPFTVNEMCYEDFYDLKQLASDIGPLTMTHLKLTEVKVMKVVLESPVSVYYKNSYNDEFQEAKIITKKK